MTPAGPLLYSDPPYGTPEWHAQQRLFKSYAVVFFAHAMEAAYGVRVLRSGRRVWTIARPVEHNRGLMDDALRYAGLPIEEVGTHHG